MAIQEAELRPNDQAVKKGIVLTSSGKINGKRIKQKNIDRAFEALVENVGDQPPLGVPGAALVDSTTPADLEVLEKRANEFWLTKAGKEALEKSKKLVPQVDNTGIKILIGTAAVLATTITAYEVYKHHIAKKKAEEKEKKDKV